MSGTAAHDRKQLPWWLWPNLLGLDAPLVAVVWQQALARMQGVAIDRVIVESLRVTRQRSCLSSILPLRCPKAVRSHPRSTARARAVS